MRNTFNKLSLHAQLFLFVGLAVGFISVSTAAVFGFSIAKAAMLTFIIVSVCYLVIDFYERQFGE